MSISKNTRPIQAYNDGRTEQAFKDMTDINKIIKKAAKGQTISHLSKYEGVYGDFADIPDLMEAQERLARGKAIFDELPTEVKREFGQDPGSFFEFVNDPANAGKLEELLPAIAEPGRYFATPGKGFARNPDDKQSEKPPAAQSGQSKDGEPVGDSADNTSEAP